MNVRRYKCPVFRPVRLPGGRTIELRPLSGMAIDRAIEETRAWFMARGIDPVGDHYELEEAIRVLGQAASCAPAELRAALSADEAWRLYATWARLQQEHTPDLTKLGRHLRWGVACDAEIAVDGTAAARSQSPTEFYGRPAAELTIGQLAYYLLLRAAHDEVHGSDRKVTRKWLETMRQSDA